jgi:predicted NBD/HSP70 family sugar kinase
MLSKANVDRVQRGLERRALWERAEQAAVPVAPPTMWCVYYTGERTSLALAALDGTIQFTERDPQPEPIPGDLAFAAAGGPWVRVKRDRWPGDEAIQVVIFGRVSSTMKNRPILENPVVWRNAPGHLLTRPIAERLQESANASWVRRPLLCAAVGPPLP